jgi:Helix-turn-helix.|nr:MAG TPA: helix-turn-helix domain protein [Caudoviricetes sp.]
MLKPVIRVEEMIRTIKEHYNLNSSMLANNLGVDAQTVYKWEKGDNKPSMKYYNKIKEFYEGIVKEDKEEALEQPEIANKEVIEDITAGTPFINLTGAGNNENMLINASTINYINPFTKAPEYTEVSLNEEYLCVKESPAEILELIRKKIKENEKN